MLRLVNIDIEVILMVIGLVFLFDFDLSLWVYYLIVEEMVYFVKYDLILYLIVGSISIGGMWLGLFVIFDENLLVVRELVWL